MKKQTENTTATTEKKQSRAEQTEAKRTAVIDFVKGLGYEIKATPNDTEKKKRFYAVADNKTLAFITYSLKDNLVRVNTGTEYKNSVYHAGWSGPYSSEVDYTKELASILAEIAEKKQKKQTEAEQKKAEKKQKQTAEKQTEKKAETAEKPKQSRQKKQTAPAEQKKQTTRRKATTADLQKKATAKK